MDDGDRPPEDDEPSTDDTVDPSGDDSHDSPFEYGNLDGDADADVDGAAPDERDDDNVTNVDSDPVSDSVTDTTPDEGSDGGSTHSTDFDSDPYNEFDINTDTDAGSDSDADFRTRLDSKSVDGRDPDPRTAGGGSKPASAPAAEPGTTAASDDDGRIVYRFFNDQDGPLMWIREMLSSAAVVLAIGLLLFGVSGVWPPMVAVESGSMEPNMVKGDLIFVTDPGRFAPDGAIGETGVVTHEIGTESGYSTFGSGGSVIVFDEPGNPGAPIIHRAHLYVEEDENWYDRANDDFHSADSCDELRNCPAPRSGFVTKGDDNPNYDQATTIAPVVDEAWVTGVARLRIPYLGWIRLLATGQATLFGVTPIQTLSAAAASALVVGRQYRMGA